MKQLSFTKIKPQLATSLAISFVLGVCVFQLHTHLPERWLFVVACCSIIGLLYFKRLLLGMLVIGWCWSWVFAAIYLGEKLAPDQGHITVTAEVLISNIPECDRAVCRFNAQLFAARDHLSAQQLPPKVRLNWYAPKQELQVGQRWLLELRLKPVHGMMNPGGFDYERWLFSHRIAARGYVRCKSDCLLLGVDRGWWMQVQRFRAQTAERISSWLPHSSVAGLLSAMTVGIRSDIDDQQWGVLRATGTVHLMAISGLHIGLIAGLMFIAAKFIVSRWLNLRYSSIQIAAGCSFIAALVYALLAGLSVPTQRALIMLLVVLGGLMLQKTLRPLHSLTLAAFVMVLVNPLAVLSNGFWLSFGAVLLILLFLGGRKQSPKYWIGSWAIGWRTGLGLSPLLLLFFGQTSIITPLANMLAVPLVSFLIIPAALLALCLNPISEPAAQLLMRAVAWLLEHLLDALQLLAAVPFSSFNLSQPQWLAVSLALIGVFLLSMPKGLSGRYLGIILLLPVFAPWQQRIAYGLAHFTLLDVGQGLSAVVQTSEHVLVFDAGVRLSAGFDMGESVVVPYLRKRGVEGIDQLLLSHSDRDHIGGAHSLLQAFQVEQVISSDPTHIKGINAELCETGKQWNWDGVEFQLLAPLQPLFADDNNNSCVLKVTAGADSVLLTGDIEHEAEAGLVELYGDQLRSSVLVVPHHGSNTSSSADFIAQVDPEYALLPVGFQNQYGFPHSKVVRRYQQQNTGLLNAAYSGAISIELGGNEPLKLDEYRYVASRYWNVQ